MNTRDPRESTRLILSPRVLLSHTSSYSTTERVTARKCWSLTIQQPANSWHRSHGPLPEWDSWKYHVGGCPTEKSRARAPWSTRGRFVSTSLANVLPFHASTSSTSFRDHFNNAFSRKFTSMSRLLAESSASLTGSSLFFTVGLQFQPKSRHAPYSGNIVVQLPTTGAYYSGTLEPRTFKHRPII